MHYKYEDFSLEYTSYSIQYTMHPNKLDVLEFWTKLVSVETGCSGCTEIIENRKLYNRKFPQCWWSHVGIKVSSYCNFCDVCIVLFVYFYVVSWERINNNKCFYKVEKRKE